jgi:nicotinate-nucleotide pyrophosphorylase (carboxylating)
MAERDERPPVDEEGVRQLVAEALREDGARNDATTAFLGIGARAVAAEVVARSEGVIAGIDVARLVFEEADRTLRFEARARDGARVGPGDVVVRVSGDASGILAAERTALNFLQRLSGVATLTARFVERLRGTGVVVLDTRKTTPLLRRLEKYAVRVGGGENHRFSLSDMVLVKENHIRAAGGIVALKTLLERSGLPADVEVEVEVDSIAMLREIVGARIDRVMLDNFSPAEVTEAVAMIAEHRRLHPDFSPSVEVSGGIHLDNVRDYAVPGVHYISIGALTHSPPALDLSLEVVTYDRP